MDKDTSEFELLHLHLNRRTVLRGAVLGGIGLGAAALIGCGDDDDDEAVATATQAAATATATQAAAAATATQAAAAATATQAAAAATATQAAAQTTSAAGLDPPGDYVNRAEQDGAPFPYNFPEPAGEPKRGGTLELAVVWDVVGWDQSVPGHNNTALQFTTDSLISYVTGVQMDKWRNVIQPQLASGWELSPDGLTYTFALQDGVRFHNKAPVNGRDLVANDVVATYNRYATEGRWTNLLSDVDAITAPDDRTVAITLGSPSPDFLDNLAVDIPIYPPELFEGDFLGNDIVGTGPAILEEADAGNFVRLSSNADYFLGAPYLDGVEFRVMPDAAARTAAFRVEQVAHAFYVPNVVREANALLESNPDANILSDPVLATVWTWGFNLTNPKFIDDRVRQAISLGFNRDKVVELVYQGFAKYPGTLAWPFVWDEFPTDEQRGRWFGHDPAEARKLITAAGFEDGIEFKLVYTPSHGAASDNENQIMKDDLAEAGITVNLDNVGGRTEFTAVFNNTNYPEAASGGFAPAFTPTGFYADSIISGSGQNYWYLNDPVLDDLAERQKHELDPDTRRDLLRQIWDIEYEKVLRLGKSREFLLTGLQPWLRYYRFNGAAVSINWSGDWGMGYHRAWIDK